MRRLLVLLPLGLALAACGGSKQATTTTTATAPSPAGSFDGSARTLYRSGTWAVVQDGALAVVLRLRGGEWKLDRSDRVLIEVLGPKRGGTTDALPQVAVQMVSKAPLVESALWVDGKELLEKGGGSPTRGTIYGAPDARLKPGPHVAVAYARTATSGVATAWRFTVR